MTKYNRWSDLDMLLPFKSRAVPQSIMHGHFHTSAKHSIHHPYIFVLFIYIYIYGVFHFINPPPFYDAFVVIDGSVLLHLNEIITT